MHMGFRMAPLWGVDNLHFGSLFRFLIKVPFLPHCTSRFWDGEWAGSPPHFSIHAPHTDTDQG